MPADQNPVQMLIRVALQGEPYLRKGNNPVQTRACLEPKVLLLRGHILRSPRVCCFALLISEVAVAYFCFCKKGQNYGCIHSFELF